MAETGRKRALLSDDGAYRYWLSRSWDDAVWNLGFVMLNPSTADAAVDDPTIVRCAGFARRLGYGGITVLNLYAYRATQPADLWKAADPVGPDNDRHLALMLAGRAEAGSDVIAAWGANAKPDRVAEVLALPGAERMQCLGHTKHGAPRHPLYLPSDAPLLALAATP